MKNDPPGCRADWQAAGYDKAVVARQLRHLACQSSEKALAKALAVRALDAQRRIFLIDGKFSTIRSFNLTYRGNLAEVMVAPGCAGARHLDKKTLAALKAVADQLRKQKPPPKKKPAPKTKAN